MEILQQNLSGFILLLVLGLRHGLDPDHITVIDGYTYRLHQKHHAWTRWVGTLFALGHGLMVTVIALALSLLRNNVEIPYAVNIVIDWLPAFMLAMMGVANVVALTRADGSQPKGIRSGMIPDALSKHLNPFTVLITGIIFGFIFDTSSQIAAFAYAVSVAGNWIYAVIGGAVFSAGLIMTGTLDSLLLSKLLKTFDQKKIQNHRFKLNVLITIMCFAIPLYKVACALCEDLELNDLQNNIAGLTFIAIILTLYLDLYLRSRAAARQEV
jgi:high-affinity nickel-transport protein